MRHLLTTLIAAFSVFCLRATAGEVTTTYEVVLNGQKFIVNTESTTNVVVESKKLALSVRETPLKKFSDENLSFSFPAAHAVLKEEEADITTWTLDGQDNVLMVYKIKDMDPAEFVEEMTKSLKETYGRKTKQTSCKGAFGNETLDGQRITATLAGETITQEIFGLKAGTAGYVLIIQDSGEKESVETQSVKKILKDTFTRKPIKRAKPD